MSRQPFSLHAAMAGDPLVFRNGKPVNGTFRYHGESLPFAFCLEVVDDEDTVVLYYNEAGRRFEDKENHHDLFMAPKLIRPENTAPALLDAAARHMDDRAKTYDKPEGERSMERAVTAFNAVTGRDMTEAEGWLFMCMLKNVRAFTNTASPHRDSLEDAIAYQSLLAESMLLVRPIF